MRREVSTRRAGFMRQLAASYFNLDREIPVALSGVAERFCGSAMSASIEATYTGISVFFETDFAIHSWDPRPGDPISVLHPDCCDACQKFDEKSLSRRISWITHSVYGTD